MPNKTLKTQKNATIPTADRSVEAVDKVLLRDGLWHHNQWQEPDD